MGVTEAAKIKISNCSAYSGKSAFFQITDSSSFLGPLDDLGSKNAKAMTPIKFWFWWFYWLRGLLLYPECLAFKLGNPFL